MHLLLTDETNMRPSDTAKFFAYGGLLFPIERLNDLHLGIECIRAEAGYRSEDELKFDTHARPPGVAIEVATEAKRKVVDLCLASGCKFIVHVILHAIMSGQNQDEQVRSAANYVIGRYNYYLAQVGDYGICIVDNLPVRSQFRYLTEKFTRGLGMPDDRQVPLDRVRLLAASCLNASHAMSALDIVLGSFRYCINSPSNPDAASQMMKQVVRMLWHRYEASRDAFHVEGLGLITRPPLSEIRHTPYREEYDRLFEHLNALLAATEPERR